MAKQKRTKPGPKPQVGLTDAQQDTLHIIQQYQQAHGMSPTVREIAEVRGIKSASAIEVIQQLENKGHLKRDKGKARAIEMLERSVPVNQIAQVVSVEVLGKVFQRGTRF